MTKPEMRALFLERRRRMSAEATRDKSAAILARVAALPWVRQAPQVLTYVSSKDNEVDTFELIRWLLQEGRPVRVPVCAPGRTLVWPELARVEDLVRGAFGIWEPGPDCRRTHDPDPDAVVIVPGVAFTRDGYRIGYGAGYFDRFLARHAGPSIGLAYEACLVETIPVEPHDIPVDLVVTEAQTYGSATFL